FHFCKGVKCEKTSLSTSLFEAKPIKMPKRPFTTTTITTFFTASLLFLLLSPCSSVYDEYETNGATKNSTTANDMNSITTAPERAAFIRSMARSAFAAYQRHAWGQDLLLPVTESFAS